MLHIRNRTTASSVRTLPQHAWSEHERPLLGSAIPTISTCKPVSRGSMVQVDLMWWKKRKCGAFGLVSQNESRKRIRLCVSWMESCCRGVNRAFGQGIWRYSDGIRDRQKLKTRFSKNLKLLIRWKKTIHRWIGIEKIVTMIYHMEEMTGRVRFYVKMNFDVFRGTKKCVYL